MSQIKLTTPEGYFEKSMQTTMDAVAKVRRRRMAVLSGVAAGGVVAAALAVFVVMQGSVAGPEVDPGFAERFGQAGITGVAQVVELAEGPESAGSDTYYAMEAEMARLDIFLEINQ